MLRIHYTLHAVIQQTSHDHDDTTLLKEIKRFDTEAEAVEWLDSAIQAERAIQIYRHEVGAASRKSAEKQSEMFETLADMEDEFRGKYLYFSQSYNAEYQINKTYRE